MENKKLRELLLNLGFYSNLQGYHFIIKAYNIISKQKIHTSMTTIYEKIGKEFEKSPSSIERAIRHIITKTYKKGILNKIYDSCPDNSEFLYDLYFNFDIIEDKINMIIWNKLEETNEESKTKNKDNASNTID